MSYHVLSCFHQLLQLWTVREVNDGVHKPFFWKVNAVKNVLETGKYDWALWSLVLQTNDLKEKVSSLAASSCSKD